MNFWHFIGDLFLPQLTWRREVDQKVVYITFDDGPHPELTPWVLKELNKVGALATFFMVGENVQKYNEVYNLVREDGHSVGNHTMNHVKGWRMRKNEYLENIQQCSEVVAKNSGIGLFRPPFGQINFKSIKKLQEDYEVIMWDVLTKDYLQSLNVKKAQKRIQKATQPGSIVVFHDSEKAEKNLKTLLPEYLAFLQKEGYQMRTL